MTQISATGLSDAQIVAGYVTFLASYLVFALGNFPGLKIDRPAAAIIGGGVNVCRPHVTLATLLVGWAWLAWVRW